MNGVVCSTVLSDWWGRCVGVEAGSKGKLSQLQGNLKARLMMHSDFILRALGLRRGF